MDPRVFFENYQSTDIEKDPLPLRVLRNTIVKSEIPGQALHWGFDYLDQRQCPLPLINQILEKLYQEVLQSDFSECVEVVEDSLDVQDGGKDGTLYEPLKLMRAVVKKLDEICLKEKEDYHDSVDGMVESPDLQPHVFAISYYNIKNTRRHMEDRMTILPRMDRLFKMPTPVSYFAVFDGHNGVEAAAYGAAQLHQFLIQSINQNQDVIPSISDAFETLDETFVNKCRQNDKIKSGSTVVLSLITPDKLYVAWLGDSQAVLAKRNEVSNLVSPHKPERKDEIDRIRSLGGEVIQMHDTYRVNGNLAVSRAIGDVDQKTFIISTPDIKMLELDGSEEFLILACDGLWDEVSPEAAANIVRRQVVADPKDVPSVSQKLITQAKQKGSSDNISVIVVFLEPLESIKNRYEGALEPELETEVTILKQSPEPAAGVVTMEKFIEHGIDGVGEMNGHAKEGEQLVDFLSFGSSKESAGKIIDDDIENHSGDEVDKKEVEDDLSDAQSDDEWQFEKPTDQGVSHTIIPTGNGLAENPFGSHAEADLTGAPDAGALLINAVADSPLGHPIPEDAFAKDQQIENATEPFNPFSTQAEPSFVDVVSGGTFNPFSNQLDEPVGGNAFHSEASALFTDDIILGEEKQLSKPVSQEPPPLTDAATANDENKGSFDNNWNVMATEFVPGNDKVGAVIPEAIDEVIALEKQTVSDTNQQIVNDLSGQVDSAPIEGELLVDILSFGTSKETAGKIIDDGIENHSSGEVDKKEVEDLSDAQSDDEWKFEKPTDQGVSHTIIPTDNGLAENPFESHAEADLIGAPDEGALLINAVADSPLDHPITEDTFAKDQQIENVSEPFNPFSNQAEASFADSDVVSGGALNPFSNQLDEPVLEPGKAFNSEASALFTDNALLGEETQLSQPMSQEPPPLTDAATTNDEDKGSFDNTLNLVATESVPENEKLEAVIPEKIAEVSALEQQTVSDTNQQIVNDLSGQVDSAPTTDTSIVPSSESLPKPADLPIPVDKKAGSKAGTKSPVKSPLKPDAPVTKSKSAASSAAAPKKSPIKSAAAAPKPPGLVNGKPATTVPRAAPKPTTASGAPRPPPAARSAATTSIKTTGAPRVGASTTTRSAPSKAAVNGIEKPSTTATKSASATTMRMRPATAPTAQKPAGPKPANTSGNSTTSPKKVPTVGPTPRPATSRPAPATAGSKVLGDASTKPGPARLARPKPTTGVAASAPKPGLGGADAKRTAAPRPTTSSVKTTTSSAKPLVPRTVPMSSRTAPPSKPATTAATRAAATRVAPKVPGDASKPAGTLTNRTASRPAAAATTKAPMAPKKVDSSALKSRKPVATAPGNATSKTMKSTINKKVAAAGNEKAELIQQNGVGPNETSENVKELNVVNGSINGDFHGMNGETEKQDAVKENGVHLDDESADKEDASPTAAAPAPAPVVEDLLS